MDAILDLFAILAPTAISILSAYMGIKLSQSQPHKCVWVFILLIGILGSGMTCWQQSRSREAHRKEVEAYTKEVGELKGSIEYLKGQSDTMARLLPDQFKGLGVVIRDTVPELARQAAKEYSSQKLTNQELSQKAISLAKRMRTLEEKYHREMNIRITQNMARHSNNLSKEDSLRQFWQEQADESRYRYEFETEFKNNLLGEAVYLKDELLKLLPEEPRPKRYELIAFDGILAGPSPVTDAANYLERLARKLSPQLGN